MKLVAWLSVTLAGGDPAPLPVDPTKSPVVLLHGIDGSARDMSRLARALRASGREVFTPSLVPSDGTATIEELSTQLASFVEAELPGRAFDLVGYSMGGIVARHYLHVREGHQRVGRFVSLSAPHHGTLGAFFRRSPGARQMRIASTFIVQLSQTGHDCPIPTTSFWTPTDLIILPPTSSRLPYATNVRVFGLGHFSCIIEKRCIDRVVACLDEPSR